jgi:rod shape-determining protein MreD
MSQKVATLLIIFFSAILQTAVFSNLFFWGLGPDILLLLVIFWTIQEGFEKALGKNILIGFIFDLITFYSVGTHIFSFVLVSFFVGLISRRFLVIAAGWRVFIVGITIIFCTWANSLFLNGLFSTAEYFNRANISDAPVHFFSGMLVKAAILNILFFPLVYFLLKSAGKVNFFKTQNGLV